MLLLNSQWHYALICFDFLIHSLIEMAILENDVSSWSWRLSDVIVSVTVCM